MAAPSFNPLIAGLNAPPIPIVQRSADAYGGQLGDLIDLSQVVPGYPPHPSLMNHLEAAAARTDLLGYGPIPGEDCLRQAYSTHLSTTYEASVAPDETHITSGCNQAFVATALTVAGAGDSLLLVTPYYFNHDTTLSMLGIGTRTIQATPENNFLPDPEDLAAAITPDIKAIACVTPNNPTGAVYPPELLEQLFDLCVAKNIWLIVDETYRDFLPQNQPIPHNLLQRSNWRDHFIGLYSFSKSFCIPGHRLGAVTGGDAVISNIAKVMDNLQICAPRAPQHAVAAGLGELSEWQAGNRQEIEHRRIALIDVMDKLSGWEIATIGAYFSYIRHPHTDRSSVEVAEFMARERGVVTLPGSFFGQGQDAFLRFAFANATADELEKLTHRLG
ncbi:MAG: aminotransferase [Rhizobiaceae bacterium]|nr:aminotransferase [Rhizobiaceae bacterium]